MSALVMCLIALATSGSVFAETAIVNNGVALGDYRKVIVNYDVPNQSRGTWHSGFLRKSSPLPHVAMISRREPSVREFLGRLGEQDRSWIRKRGYLPIETEGWHYGNRRTIETIMVAAGNIARKFPDDVDRPLLIDNISTQHGGGGGNDHESHRNGLDADLVYYDLGREHSYRDSSDSKKRNMAEEYQLGTRRFRTNAGRVWGEIHPNFDFERNWELLKELARVNLDSERRTGRKVVRFAITHKVIATALSKYAKERRSSDPDSHLYDEALSLIWPKDPKIAKTVPDGGGHSTHMHVRFNKP